MTTHPVRPSPIVKTAPSDTVTALKRARTGDHIAFKATPEVLEATAAKLQAMGRELIRARGNTSLYFFDYDDHVFELDTADITQELGG
jgi:hypothetical protein